MKRTSENRVGVRVPVYRQQTIFEMVRGVKAFLRLDLGLVRGTIPDLVGSQSRESEQVWKQLKTTSEKLERKERELAELRTRTDIDAAVAEATKPENIIWMFGTARVGTTWLASMMEDLNNHTIWHEPLVGDLFGEFYYVRAGAGHRHSKHFILGRHREVWLRSIRSFILEGVRGRFPGATEDGFLVVKEPNGSTGAPLVIEAIPESRMLFLIRDPRDVVASVLDASREGSWNYEKNRGAAWSRRSLADRRPEVFVKGRAEVYTRQITHSREAYDSHRGPKALVRYEELVGDTLGTMRRIYWELGIEVDEKELERAVEKHAWENISEDKKGEGKFYRKASPGGWREDLTPRQVEIVEKVTAPILNEFYPS